jgi:hypothetical protein
MDWLFRFADPSIDWNYAMIGLLVRFIGVFFVMFVVQVALQISARAVRVIEARQMSRQATTQQAPVAPAAMPASAEELGALEPAVAAAIGVALALESHALRPRQAPGASGGPSAWAVAGRLAQLDRRPKR